MTVPRQHVRLGVIPTDAIVGAPEPTCVVDGRHRVSVARALGHRDIKARVARALRAAA